MKPETRERVGLFLKVLGILLLVLSLGYMFKGGLSNEPPRIVEFMPQYGTIGPADTDEWVIVFVEDEQLPSELRYEWEVSEGVFGLTEEPNVISYKAPIASGSYYVFVTVTVTDNWGAKATATTRILVWDGSYLGGSG